jgi:uncharacterized membrane protein YeaQ/YmgE (transglycosylase-associated protein family)
MAEANNFQQLIDSLPTFREQVWASEAVARALLAADDTLLVNQANSACSTISPTKLSTCRDESVRIEQNRETSGGRRLMNVDAQKLIIWAIIGIVAGWLASVVVGGGGGLLRYLITGLIGAFVGGFVFQMAGWKLNLGNDWIEQIVVAAIGAIIVVILARMVV